MAKLVDVYGKTTCQDTNNVRGYLEEQGFEYGWHDIEESQTERDHANDLSNGANRWPVVLVRNIVLVEPSTDELAKAIETPDDQE